MRFSIVSSIVVSVAGLRHFVAHAWSGTDQAGTSLPRGTRMRIFPAQPDKRMGKDSLANGL